MIVVCIMILAVHSYSHPYILSRANLTESLYLLVLCMLAVMQIVPKIVEDKNAYRCIMFISVVLFVIALIHTIVVFFCKAVRFFQWRLRCCTGAQNTVVDRRGYEELENTHNDQDLDSEVERQRSVMDMIFKSPARPQLHG